MLSPCQSEAIMMMTNQKHWSNQSSLIGCESCLIVNLWHQHVCCFFYIDTLGWEIRSARHLIPGPRVGWRTFQPSISTLTVNIPLVQVRRLHTLSPRFKSKILEHIIIYVQYAISYLMLMGNDCGIEQNIEVCSATAKLTKGLVW